MKSNLRFILLMSFTILFGGSLYAQTWADVIVEERGDTVVVKPTSMGGGLNSMFAAIMGDTTSTGDRTNPNRVYETVRGETYVYDGPAYIDATVGDLRIVAPDGTDMPPLHIKTTDPTGGQDKAFYGLSGVNFYMKNQSIVQAQTNDALDRNFFRSTSDDLTIEFDNCIVELTNWAWLSNWTVGSVFKVTNCIIHNLGAEANLEKGNLMDGSTPIDTFWFENNTVLNHGNVMVTRPNAGPNFAYFNHNTIVNGTNNPFLFFGQAEMIATNNIFMNTGLVPDYPGFYAFYEDEDKLPKGIINVDTLEAAWIEDHWLGEYPVASDSDRKILVDKNNAWWDPRFTDMFTNDLAPIPAEIGETWASQMITMNSRTQAMFDDDAAYPYFVEGTWYNVEADFTENKDMVPEWVSFIVTNAIPGDPNGGDPQPKWRTNMDTNVTEPDFPLLFDLSYDDATLYTGGVNNYPLGDLNWFPVMKSLWEETNEAEELIAALKAGTVVDDWAPVGIKDNIRSFNSNIEVYPNPVTSSTTLKFDLVKSSNVELNIYNVLGERVKMIELGQFSAGIQEVSLNKGDLKPGIYMIQLNTNYNNAGLITKISVK